MAEEWAGVERMGGRLRRVFGSRKPTVSQKARAPRIRWKTLQREARERSRDLERARVEFFKAKAPSAAQLDELRKQYKEGKA
jgi:hypothetical protein